MAVAASRLNRAAAPITAFVARRASDNAWSASGEPGSMNRTSRATAFGPCLASSPTSWAMSGARQGIGARLADRVVVDGDDRHLGRRRARPSDQEPEIHERRLKPVEQRGAAFEVPEAEEHAPDHGEHHCRDRQRALGRGNTEPHRGQS